MCPLFDLERAVGDVLGENTPNMIEIRLPPGLAARLAGEPAPITAPPLDLDWHAPDTPPAEWRRQDGEEPPNRDTC